MLPGCNKSKNTATNLLSQNKIMKNLFHLAFPVKNLEESRRFYDLERLWRDAEHVKF